MSYLPNGLPIPVPESDGLDKPYWDATRRGELLVQRCKSCGTYFFPKETAFCRNPKCAGTDFEEVPLSTRGKLWSFTDNRYPPPKLHSTLCHRIKITNRLNRQLKK